MDNSKIFPQKHKTQFQKISIHLLKILRLICSSGGVIKYIALNYKVNAMLFVRLSVRTTPS